MSLSNPSSSPSGPEPIAIVGAGCWLPGNIRSIDHLLEALKEGRDMITDIPAERWSPDEFYDPDPIKPGRTYVRRGGFVSDVDRFDAGFFGISDSEAARMDPQQRMVLQTVWHALEHAGQSADDLMHSNTGVFLAMMNTNNYAQLKTYFEGVTGLTAYDAMGDAMSIAGGRIAHFLGLEGPALSLDTACSSSLVALHLARQSILSGECDAAIVVGVNAILHPGIHITFSKIGLMSRSGRCAAFDASADGYIRGEGCVAVVLRRESEAVERGDHIMASIVGTAINQDGRTPAVTAPNGRAQEKVIRSALARVGVSPSEIGYVEAHGTGTPVGDPIEMSAIVNVFGPERSSEEKLFVGSVKSNFGHIEAGAGLLGLVKTALSIEHNIIFPTVHFKQLNPNIDLGLAPVEVPSFLQPWPVRPGRRMAGVNSFGYSGTNAHAILQQAPERQGIEVEERSGELVLLSAKNQSSLEELVDLWIEYLEEKQDALPDIAFTAATGRAHLNHRIAIVASGKDDVKARLEAWRAGRIARGLASGQTRLRIKPRVAFMFTGQGAQYAGMGRSLYQTEARFAQTIDQIADYMDEELDVPLKEVLFGPESERYMQNTRYVQPAMFAIEYALADLLRYWGVEPDYLIGHSVGEISAACFGGMLDLDDAIRFVVARGRLMGALPEGGKMLALGVDMDQARAWINGREAEVSIATVNAPQAVVVSGKAEAVDAIAELAMDAGLRAKELDVSHAFHSPLMDPILDELTQTATSMRVRPASIPVMSNVSGQFHNGTVNGAYWSQHVREAVLFHAGMEKIIDEGVTLLVEIGPNPALIPAVATSFDTTKIQTVPTLRRDGRDFTNLLSALSLLFVKGAGLDLDRLFWSAAYQRVDLPLYPFRKDRHWLTEVGQYIVAEEPNSAPLIELPPLHPLLGETIVRTQRKTVFETVLTTASPWTDHRVLGKTVFPGTGYLEMAARGYAAISGQSWQAVKLAEVSFERPLVLTYRKPQSVRLSLVHTPDGNGSAYFTIMSSSNEAEVYCKGRIMQADAPPEAISLAETVQAREADIAVGPFYGELRTIGLEYGAKFANVREIWAGEDGSGKAIGRVSYARFAEHAEGDEFANAVLLDSCLHVFGPALATQQKDSLPGAFVPVNVTAMQQHRALPIEFWSYAQVRQADERGALIDIYALDDDWNVLAVFEELELRRTESMSGVQVATTPSAAGFAGLEARTRAELVEQLKPQTKRDRIKVLSRWLTAEIKGTMGQAAEGLDIETLPASTAFLEIGLDSLLVTELQRRIQEKLEFRFKPMQGLDYQSIESMAEYLHDEVLAPDFTDQPAQQD